MKSFALPLKEYFDVLDENANPLNRIKERSLVHKDGDWHRTVHIWILNSKKEILLQKRSANKETFPGLWDISVAGHVSSGQTSLQAAQRESMEEIGLKVEMEQFELLFSLKSEMKFKDILDREITDVYRLICNDDLSSFSIQKNEVDALKWMPYNDFKDVLNNCPLDIVCHQEEFDLLKPLLQKM